MAPRANWKGFLRLSLVSCPIPLYPASSLSEKVSFIPLSATTGVTRQLGPNKVSCGTVEGVRVRSTARSRSMPRPGLFGRCDIGLSNAATAAFILVLPF
jgi:hypothetical protein